MARAFSVGARPSRETLAPDGLIEALLMEQTKSF
jgi:hypothetical protein